MGTPLLGEGWLGTGSVTPLFLQGLSCGFVLDTSFLLDYCGTTQNYISVSVIFPGRVFQEQSGETVFHWKSTT